MSVEIYTVRREIDGLWYEDAVCARSWEEAEVLAEKLEGKLTGKIEEEIPVTDEEIREITTVRVILCPPKTDGYEIN